MVEVEAPFRSVATPEGTVIDGVTLGPLGPGGGALPPVFPVPPPPPPLPPPPLPPPGFCPGVGMITVLMVEVVTPPLLADDEDVSVQPGHEMSKSPPATTLSSCALLSVPAAHVPAGTSEAMASAKMKFRILISLLRLAQNSSAKLCSSTAACRKGAEELRRRSGEGGAHTPTGSAGEGYASGARTFCPGT